MSGGIITTESIQDAVHRAREPAAIDTTSNTSLKRPIEEEFDLHPAKRANTEGMDGSGLVQMGGGYMQMGGNPTENVVEIISIPDNTVGLVIGRNGTEIQNIQAQSGCRVQMSGESEPGSNIRQCTLTGNRHSVDRAKQLINDVISRAGQRQQQQMMQPPQQNVSYGGGDGMANTVDMLIPANKCGLIIGKQGDTIKQLQETSGCKMVMIQDSQEVTGQAKPLRITGTPDKIEHAKRLVGELLSSRDDSGAPVPGGMARNFVAEQASAKGEVVVPRSSVGMIIGKGGETIKRLAMESGTKIQFKPDEDPNSADRVAVIMGTREQIYKATELITELVHRSMNGGANGGGGGPAATNEIFYMHVPSNKTGLVIGKGGETIKQINSESGAHCELSRDPPPNAQEKVFIIKGTPYQIHHAQHIIRIKVGDVPPGTPIPHFSGPGGPQMGGFSGASHFNGQPMMAQQNQWSSNYGQPQDANGWNGQQAGQPYYAGGQNSAPAANFGAAQQYQQPSAPQFAAPAVQQNAVPVVAASQQVAQSTPVINPQTGQPDYSAQWAEYYRSMGMHDQATMIEQQMKNRSGGAPTASAGAAPSQPTAGYVGTATSAYPGAAGQPAAAQYAGYAGGQPQQFPQTGQFAAPAQQF